MKRLIITEEEKNHIKGLYEQTTGTTQTTSGTTQPVDLNYILKQSESEKTTNEFCKSKTGYDVCLSVKNSDRAIRDRVENDRSRILQPSGYTMIEKSPLTQDADGQFKKTSIWKKTT
jgi:hypothetical protein